MNDCKRYEELICALIDGELSEEERETVNAHCETCRSCKMLLDTFTAVSASLDEEELPEGLHEDIMASVRRESKKKKSPWTRVLPLAACFALVIFLGTRVGTDKAPTEPAGECVNDSETYTVTFDASQEDAGEMCVSESFSVTPMNELYNSQFGPDRSETEPAEAESNDADARIFSAARLRELLTPLENLRANDAGGEVNDAAQPAKAAAPAMSYCVTFTGEYGEETVFIGFRDGKAYADFGSGPVEVTGTPEEILEIFFNE